MVGKPRNCPFVSRPHRAVGADDAKDDEADTLPEDLSVPMGVAEMRNFCVVLSRARSPLIWALALVVLR